MRFVSGCCRQICCEAVFACFNRAEGEGIFASPLGKGIESSVAGVAQGA